MLTTAALKTTRKKTKTKTTKKTQLLDLNNRGNISNLFFPIPEKSDRNGIWQNQRCKFKVK